MAYKPKYAQSGSSPKKWPLVLILVLVLALAAGVGGWLLLKGGSEEASPTQPETTLPIFTTAAPTTEPTTEPTTVPTTEPIVYFNPLNGAILDGPYTGRLFASTVANEDDAAIPHVNTLKADILIESFVNNNKTRCLALFTDPSNVEAIGSVRSTRPMFNDIAKHYNLLLSHAGGSDTSLGNADDHGIDHFNVDSLIRQNDPLKDGTAYRDKEHPRIKYGDANLYAVLPGVKAYAESIGIQTENLPETDYGLRFQEDGTPAEGESAGTIDIRMIIKWAQNKVTTKDTKMVYDYSLDKYVWHQYKKEMRELFTGEPEAFTNVIIMFYQPLDHIRGSGSVYYHTDFLAGGTGYYANGGKIIPITWSCDGDTAPFRFFKEDGSPLLIGQGNTYMNLAPFTDEHISTVTWTPADPPPETEPAETETTPAA